ncbi:MAG TPA: hypothetical protein PLD54_03250 [Candidatus Levybacteria bacterium]|nr:hypothetical protein [Candidatus Levybacteria bacterium]
MKETQPGQNNYQEQDPQGRSDFTEDNLSDDVQNHSPDILNKRISRRGFLRYATGIALATATGSIGANCVIPGFENVNDPRREDTESTPETEATSPFSSATFTPEATSTNVPPTETPTRIPTIEPTQTSTPEPTSTPTLEPTPTPEPTVEPTATPEAIRFNGTFPFEALGVNPEILGFNAIIPNPDNPLAEQNLQELLLRSFAQLYYASTTPQSEYSREAVDNIDVEAFKEKLLSENIEILTLGHPAEDLDKSALVKPIEIDPSQGMKIVFEASDEKSSNEYKGNIGGVTGLRLRIGSDEENRLVIKWFVDEKDARNRDDYAEHYGYLLVYALNHLRDKTFLQEGQPPLLEEDPKIKEKVFLSDPPEGMPAFGVDFYGNPLYPTLVPVNK